MPLDQALPASELAKQTTFSQTGSGLTTSSLVGVPTGVILPYAGTTAPTADWLLLDGTDVSRTSYSSLFSLFGTTYGVGDGSSTFGLPDLRGRIPVGKGAHADVSALGGNEGSAVANRRPKHPHSHALTTPDHKHGPLSGTSFITNPGGPDGVGVAGANYNEDATTGNPTTHPGIDGTIGAAGTANDAPAYIVLNYIIKV